MSPVHSDIGRAGILRRVVATLAAAVLLHPSAPELDGQARATASAEHGSAMVEVPSGRFTPQYATAGDGVEVDAFLLDRTPVTVADFRRFLEQNPEWRSSRVPPVFADEGYLGTWVADLDPGVEGEALRRPVTQVSWFAARSYCAWRGARLPTTDEWEYAAAASRTEADASQDGAFDRVLLDLYGSRPPADALPPVGETFRNVHGVWDLHGLVWEWTSDFNNQMVTGAGRDDRALDRQLFCAAGSLGATDMRDYAGFLRYSYRASLTGAYVGLLLGFRCAADLPSPDNTASP